ncbi:MAG: hypothetical protein JJU36_17990 [Phycisphaeraceae bacterium]|nr:hypothetical protein [Phycisphaeraceae bacterium]
MSKHDDDNRSNQMNPNNDAYWESRGWDDRPDDWEERVDHDPLHRDPFDFSWPGRGTNNADS